MGCRSDALIMYMTGPMPDPWITLELMLRLAIKNRQETSLVYTARTEL